MKTEETDIEYHIVDEQKADGFFQALVHIEDRLIVKIEAWYGPTLTESATHASVSIMHLTSVEWKTLYRLRRSALRELDFDTEAIIRRLVQIATTIVDG